MRPIPDFSDSELWIVETTLRERYGRKVPYELAESDIRLRSSDRELTPCPIVYWEDGDCHLVVIKTGEKAYRNMFFYRVHQQYGTGVPEYDDLTECVVSLLQAQADHERERRREEDETTGDESKTDSK
ncbi:MAG TPA: hypothetical protein ENK54_05290 [Thiotrichales bacterium]|nr:hypothetical protein [Thiotrichales bacterium]